MTKDHKKLDKYLAGIKKMIGEITLDKVDEAQDFLKDYPVPVIGIMVLATENVAKTRDKEALKENGRDIVDMLKGRKKPDYDYTARGFDPQSGLYFVVLIQETQALVYFAETEKEAVDALEGVRKGLDGMHKR